MTNQDKRNATIERLRESVKAAFDELQQVAESEWDSFGANEPSGPAYEQQQRQMMEAEAWVNESRKQFAVAFMLAQHSVTAAPRA